MTSDAKIDFYSTFNLNTSTLPNSHLMQQKIHGSLSK